MLEHRTRLFIDDAFLSHTHKQSTMAKQLPQEDEFVLPKSTTDLHDLATELWFNYFALGNPPKPTEESRKLLQRYNLCATEVNKRAGRQVVILITPSTRWIPSEGAKDPSKKKIAASVTTTGKKEPVKQPVKAVKEPVKREGSTGKIAEIIALHKQGKTNKEIIELGYNKNTVNINVSSYIKTGKSTTSRV